jgi:glycerol-1-phosphate dehydrogenase [NAD(P)+]
MFYHSFKSPAIIKTGNHVLKSLDELLFAAHLHFPKKILVTQQVLWDKYKDEFPEDCKIDVIFVNGGSIDEVDSLIAQINNRDALVIAFGGGSVLDLVKYCASRCDVPYINIPSTLSNDAVYSCVSRLVTNGKKISYGVQPPIGIIVSFDIIRNSPKELLLAGVADLVSNLSALKDWKLAHKNINEPIDELAYMLSKEAVIPLLHYRGEDVICQDDFLYDLTNAIVTSGLSMIVAGNTRMTSGAEHMISHAIDEYFPEKSTIHGLQVGWAHLIIERDYRKDGDYEKLHKFYDSIGLLKVLDENIPFSDEEFKVLIPYAKQIRNRYTVFNTL